MPAHWNEGNTPCEEKLLSRIGSGSGRCGTQGFQGSNHFLVQGHRNIFKMPNMADFANHEFWSLRFHVPEVIIVDLSVCGLFHPPLIIEAMFGVPQCCDTIQ